MNRAYIKLWNAVEDCISCSFFHNHARKLCIWTVLARYWNECLGISLTLHLFYRSYRGWTHVLGCGASNTLVTLALRRDDGLNMDVSFHPLEIIITVKDYLESIVYIHFEL